jgi:hypothetical protein
MDNIATGYQPQFGLGAYFAGQNAQNAEDMNAQVLNKLFQANQQTAQTNPLEVQRMQYAMPGYQLDAKTAQAAMDNPTYIADSLRGKQGEWATKAAEGEYAGATVKDKIALQKMKQAGLLSDAEFTNLLSGAKMKEASIGFPMESNEPPVSQDMTGFMKPPSSPFAVAPTTIGEGFLQHPAAPMQMPYQSAADVKTPNSVNMTGSNEARAELLANEYARTKDPSILKELQALSKTEQGYTNKGNPAPISREPVFTKMSAPKPTSDYTRLATLAAQTPEHLGKMEEIAAASEGRIQSAMVNADARVQAAEAARNRGDTLAEKELTMSAPSFENQAIRYESMITKREIEAAKNEVITSLLSDKQKDVAIKKIDSDAQMYREFANASRDMARQIYKKHGLAVSEVPQIKPTVTKAPIKLD